MTVWIEDEHGNFTFTCEDWTLTRTAGWHHNISVKNKNRDLKILVCDTRIFVTGIFRDPFDFIRTSPAEVDIPFPVLRAILEVYDPEPSPTEPSSEQVSQNDPV